jgi:hypothetical protein
VRGGLLTWDMGRNLGGGEDGVAHAKLSTHGLSNRRRRSWTLPEFTVYDEGTPKREAYSRGAWGYSSHTRYMVFWIAARTCEYAGRESGCEVTQVASVYAARL